MSVLVSDSFTRANSTTTLGSAETGQSWSTTQGTWGINSNQAYAASDANLDVATLPLNTGDYTLSCNVNGQYLGSNWREPQLVLRYIDANNYLYISNDDGGMHLNKRDGGGQSTLQATATPIVDGTTYNIRAVCVGASIKVYLNSVQLINYTLTGADSTKFSTPTSVGMRLGKGGSPTIPARWDDFTVTDLNTLVYDSFNRTDSTTTLGSTNMGQAWSAVVGSWGISGNEAYDVNDSSGDVAVLPSVGTGDYTVSCMVKGTLASATNYRRPNVLVRYIDTNNYLKVLIWNGLAILEDGLTGTHYVETATTTNDGVYYALKIVCVGANIKVYVDSVLKIDYTLTGADATKYGSSGVVGIRMSKGGSPATATRWDDFMVEAIVVNNTPKLDWKSSDFINYGDFNRLESNISTLYTYLQSIQYVVPSPVTPNTTRTVSSIDYLSSINRIENNIDAIRLAFINPVGYLGKKSWTVGQLFDFNDANRLEGNVKQLYDLGVTVYQNYRYCGTQTCGEWGLIY